MNVLFLIHYSLTLLMIGIIWFVQLVHYPAFEYASKDSFTKFHENHIRRTTRLVLPVMLSEATTAILVFVTTARETYFSISLGLLFVIWISTFAIQVPQHQHLQASFSHQGVKTLIKGNWIRTICWTFRGILLYLHLADQS